MNSPVYKTLLQSADELTSGKVGIIPTDTLYGVVACASNEPAASRLYAHKKRVTKSGTLIAASIDQLVELGLKKRYLVAVEHYWPGAISIEIPTGPVLDYLHKGTYTIAVRVPNNEGLRTLLNITGPLITSSANPPGEAPATTIRQAQVYFNDMVDFYVDGGELKGLPSTIIRVVDDAVEVLRQGSVTIDEATGRVL